MEGDGGKKGKRRKNDRGKVYPPIGLGVGLRNRLCGPFIQYRMIRAKQMENIDDSRKWASRHRIKSEPSTLPLKLG